MNRILLVIAAIIAAAAWTPVVAAQNTTGVTGITLGFNATTIAAGSTVWFNAVLKPNGPLPAGDIVINFTGQTITIGGGAPLSVPDSQVTYSTTATTATTAFNTTLNRWETTIPRGIAAKNAFLGGLAYPVSIPFSGDFAHYPVVWKGTFASPTSGVNINWQWAAAVYRTFTTSYGSLGVKPTDDNLASSYPNSDHAGTPESYKSPPPVGGATGGGASNYTGSYSPTAGITSGRITSPVLATTAQLGGSKYAGSSTISDTATLTGASTFPVASGTITFSVYGPNDANCATAPVFTTTVVVNDNGAYPSGVFIPTAAGKYRIIASYSGDTYNTPITTGCADMNESVTVNADSAPPLCTLFASNTGPPKSVDVMVQDSESGLASIEHHETNATVTAPTLTGPTTNGVTIRATKVDQSKSASFGLTVKDAAGNTTVCDPVLRAEKPAKHHLRPTTSRTTRAAGLTLHMDASRLAFGEGLTLTGGVPTAHPGEAVTVLVRPCGFNGFATLATLRTDARGRFHYAVHPTLGTTFAVAWNGVTSKSARVVVQPQLTLAKAGGRYRVDVTTTNPVFLSGTPALLQKAVGKGWRTIARTVLAENSPVTAVTVVSSGTFKTRVAGGRLRAVIPGTACYAPAASPAVGG